MNGWAATGKVEGDLRPGGQFRARFTSEWEGTGRVETCEAPRRLVVVTRQAGESEEHRIEASLTADGEQTILAIEERGLPVEHLADYGSGWQVHVEDLAAHLDGRERCDMVARWNELAPTYQALAANVPSAEVSP